GAWCGRRLGCCPTGRPPRPTLFPYTTLFRSEQESGLLPHRVAAEVLGGETRTAVVSGPTFAHEVAADLPTALTVASEDEAHALRSEEHTSELQSREKLVCRLLLEKKNDERRR